MVEKLPESESRFHHIKDVRLREQVLVSIIMPAHNGEVFIAQAVDSVLAQKHPNWELIVVDDGSTDRTRHIVAAYGDPRVRLSYQENRGQAAALNHGLDMAQGKYVTTLDVDDWLTPNSLSDRVDFLEQHPEFGAVYGDGYYCDADGEPICRFSDYRIGDVHGNVYDVLIAHPFFGTGANIMVRREVIEGQNLRYDESIVWCQDYDLYIRLAESTAFGVIQSVLLWYRLHQANMTMSLSTGKRLESLLRTKFKVLASPRFLEAATLAKVDFFYQLLVNDLQDRPHDQDVMFHHPQFAALPKLQQVSLLRIIANDYLLKGENIHQSKAWLREARRLAPLDVRTIASSLLATVNLKLAQLVLKRWRRVPSLQHQVHSPFERLENA